MAGALMGLQRTPVTVEGLLAPLGLPEFRRRRKEVSDVSAEADVGSPDSHLLLLRLARADIPNRPSGI